MTRKTKSPEEKKTAKITRAANKARATLFAEKEKTAIAKLKKSGASKAAIQKVSAFIARGVSFTDDGW